MSIPLFIFLCLKSWKIIYSNCHTRGLLRSHTTPRSTAPAWTEKTAIKRRIYTHSCRHPTWGHNATAAWSQPSILQEKSGWKGRRRVVRSPWCLFPCTDTPDQPENSMKGSPPFQYIYFAICSTAWSTVLKSGQYKNHSPFQNFSTVSRQQKEGAPRAAGRLSVSLCRNTHIPGIEAVPWQAGEWSGPFWLFWSCKRDAPGCVYDTRSIKELFPARTMLCLHLDDKEAGTGLKSGSEGDASIGKRSRSKRGLVSLKNWLIQGPGSTTAFGIVLITDEGTIGRTGCSMVWSKRNSIWHWFWNSTSLLSHFSTWRNEVLATASHSPPKLSTSSLRRGTVMAGRGFPTEGMTANSRRQPSLLAETKTSLALAVPTSRTDAVPK